MMESHSMSESSENSHYKEMRLDSFVKDEDDEENKSCDSDHNED